MYPVFVPLEKLQIFINLRETRYILVDILANCYMYMLVSSIIITICIRPNKNEI